MIRSLATKDYAHHLSAPFLSYILIIRYGIFLLTIMRLHIIYSIFPILLFTKCNLVYFLLSLFLNLVVGHKIYHTASILFQIYFFLPFFKFFLNFIFTPLVFH